MEPPSTGHEPDFVPRPISPELLKLFPTDADREAAIAFDRIDQERQWQIQETIAARIERDSMHAELAAMKKRLDETVTIRTEFTIKRNAMILTSIGSISALILSALTAWFASKQ